MLANQEESIQSNVKSQNVVAHYVSSKNLSNDANKVPKQKNKIGLQTKEIDARPFTSLND